MKPYYKTVYEGGSGELVEKKSRFIATIVPIKSEEEALQFIEEMKKKYWDATHNCSAYVIGQNNEVMRCSDDGEPSKTAGRPMLDVLLLEEIHNTCVVVTRYFGGTLLGTGGLVRAYQGAVKAGLSNCKIIKKCFGKKYTLITEYTVIGKIQYIANQMEVTILNTEYTDIVTVTLLLPLEQETAFIKKIQEAANGSIQINKIEELYFAKYKEEILLFST